MAKFGKALHTILDFELDGLFQLHQKLGSSHETKNQCLWIETVAAQNGCC
jgi:hypothetical protein